MLEIEWLLFAISIKDKHFLYLMFSLSLLFPSINNSPAKECSQTKNGNKNQDAFIKCL